MSRSLLRQYIRQIIVEARLVRIDDTGRSHLQVLEYTSYDEEEFDFVTTILLKKYGSDIENGRPRMEITKPFDGKSGKFETSAPRWEVQGLLVNYKPQKPSVPTVTLPQGPFSRATRGSNSGLLVGANGN